MLYVLNQFVTLVYHYFETKLITDFYPQIYNIVIFVHILNYLDKVQVDIYINTVYISGSGISDFYNF